MTFFSNPFAQDDSVPAFLNPSSASPSSSISSLSKRRVSLIRRSSTGLALDVGPLDGNSGSNIASGSNLNFDPIIGIMVAGGSSSSNLTNSLGSSSPPRSSRRASYASSPGSRSNSRDSRITDSASTPTPGPPRRTSLHSTPAPPLYSPTSSFVASPFFVQNPPSSRASTSAVPTKITSNDPLFSTLDFSRRRSVDVGVLGHGSHQQVGNGGRSKRMREAVGPDAGDKETGFTGSTLQGGKDRL